MYCIQYTLSENLFQVCEKMWLLDADVCCSKSQDKRRNDCHGKKSERRKNGVLPGSWVYTRIDNCGK